MASETVPPDGAPEALERRLATILAADVANYSKMMGDDEEGTVQTFRGHRAVFEALLHQHHGRVFNTAGDAILAEFPSAVEAVRCATEIQAALQTRNAHLPPAHKMQFRMGINLGDVVVQNGDLLGDGVNVAARIQTIAEPGGICISGSVYDQIQNKLSLHFRPLGNQVFKNIRQPIRTFTITEGEDGPLPAADDASAGISTRAIAATVIVVAILTAGGYWYYRDNEATRAEQATLASQLAAEKQAAAEARRAADEQSRRAADAEGKIAQDRAAAEAEKRQAELKSQAQATEDARRRNEAERKQLDDERKRLDAEKQANAAAAKAGAAPGIVATPAKSETRIATAAPAPKSGAGGVAHADGTYSGQICNFPGDPAKRICWPVELKVEKGVAQGTWLRRRTGGTSQLQATIAPDGSVKAVLDGVSPKGSSPASGAMDGRLADNHIDLTGRWANGARVDGHWTRLP